jgi:hypothetical protein
MTDRELMQMALDALEWCYDVTEWPANGGSAQDKAIEALRARLAQPEPEPVAWFMEGTFEDGAPSFTQVCETDPEFYVPLYTAPPQREWQGLTEEDVWELVQKTPNFSETVAAIEAKLKENNT